SLGLGIAGMATGAYSKPKTGAYNVSSKQNINELESVKQELSFSLETQVGQRGEYSILMPDNTVNATELFVYGHSVPIGYSDRNLKIRNNFKRSFNTPIELVTYVPEGRKLKINYPKIVRGFRDLPPYYSTIRKGEGMRNLLVSSPYTKIVGDKRLNPTKSIKLMRDILDNPSRQISRNYHILMVSTEGVIPLDEILTSLPRQYTKVHLICCRP
uniref:putative adhesin n=1 Tax=Myroides odoratus TaxID=256 RepID=UPI003340EF94